MSYKLGITVHDDDDWFDMVAQKYTKIIHILCCGSATSLKGHHNIISTQHICIKCDRIYGSLIQP